MKKFLVYIVMVVMGIFAAAAQAEEAPSDDAWNDAIKFDRNWRTNHKAVTDEDFEKVMKQYEKKKKTKKYDFEENEQRDSLNDMSILKDIASHSPIILFPAKLRSYEGEIIPAGYYKLNYFEKDKNHYIALTQGRNIIARLLMNQTKDNFKSDSIQFAEIRPNDEESMVLIYGNLDLNLVKKLYLVQ